MPYILSKCWAPLDHWKTEIWSNRATRMVHWFQDGSVSITPKWIGWDWYRERSLPWVLAVWVPRTLSGQDCIQLSFRFLSWNFYYYYAEGLLIIERGGAISLEAFGSGILPAAKWRIHPLVNTYLWNHCEGEPSGRTKSPHFLYLSRIQEWRVSQDVELTSWRTFHLEKPQDLRNTPFQNACLKAESGNSAWKVGKLVPRTFWHLT